MRIKLYSRNQIIINLVIFVLLSYVFIHVLEALKLGISALDMDRIYSGMMDAPVLVICSIAVIISVTKASRMSLKLYPAFCLFTLYKSFTMFFAHFDKLILSLIFIYVIIAFYLCVLWILELNSAAYCPKFRVNETEQKSLLSIYAEVVTSVGNKYSGYLTNWDESSCFILFDCEFFPGKTKLPVDVNISFSDSSFSQKGRIISGYGAGVGIEFYKSKVNRFDMGWNHFHSLMLDRGYLPQG